MPAHGTDEPQQKGIGDLPQVPAYETGNRSVLSNGAVNWDKMEVPKVPAHGGSRIVESPHGTVEGAREKEVSNVPSHETGSKRLPLLRIAGGGKNKAPQVRIVGVPQQGTAEAVQQDPTHGPLKGEKSQVSIQLTKHKMDNCLNIRSRGVSPMHMCTARTNQERSRGVSPVHTNRIIQERSGVVSPMRNDRTIQERSRGVSPVRTDRTNQERSRGVCPVYTNRTIQERSRGVSPMCTDDRPIGESQGRGRRVEQPRPTEIREGRYKNPLNCLKC